MINNVILFLITAISIFAMGAGVGKNTKEKAMKKDAIIKGAGISISDSKSGEVNFYWLIGGTNMVKCK
jgi:hypothetical protein